MTRQLQELLEICRTQIRDGIIYGWREDELMEPPTDTIAKLTAAIGDSYDIEKGEST